MNCEAFRILLDRVLDGEATAEEQAQLLAHEQTCEDCAALHREMAALQHELASLKEEAPPMPADFHHGWMTRVEEEAMENEKPVNPMKKQWTRILSAAAALVFVVGGTALTRDQLNAGKYTAPAAKAAVYSEPYDDYGGWANSAPSSAMGMMSRSTAASSNVAYAMEEAAYDYDMVEEAETEAAESKIIRTASLTIGTKAYDDSQAAIRQLCSDLGGYVSSSGERTNSASGLRTLTMQLRIPSAQLDTFLAGMEGTGRVTNRNETMEDVTDSYQDTKARLATQQAMMARLQSLVTEAASLQDLLTLESQIADTQYTIDRLTASLMNTDKRVNYATVDLTLREEKAGEVITSTRLTLGERLTNALEAGAEAFADFAEDMVVFLAASLPFIAVITVLWIAIHLWRKQHRKAKANKKS